MANEHYTYTSLLLGCRNTRQSPIASEKWVLHILNHGAGLINDVFLQALQSIVCPRSVSNILSSNTKAIQLCEQRYYTLKASKKSEGSKTNGDHRNVKKFAPPPGLSPSPGLALPPGLTLPVPSGENVVSIGESSLEGRNIVAGSFSIL